MPMPEHEGADMLKAATHFSKLIQEGHISPCRGRRSVATEGIEHEPCLTARRALAEKVADRLCAHASSLAELLHLPSWRLSPLRF